MGKIVDILTGLNRKSYIDELSHRVSELNKSSKCYSALAYILRALDYDPQNQSILRLARIITHGCLAPHHNCNEPVSQEQAKDQRIAFIFNECANCHGIWIPLSSVYEEYMPNILITSSRGIGGYCTKCKKAFCPNCVKDPLPSISFTIGVHCPICGNVLNDRDAFGRNPNQTPRVNKKLSQVFVIREGILPPDKGYCLKIFRNASIDVLEDLPQVSSTRLEPWIYDSATVLTLVKKYLQHDKNIPAPRRFAKIDVWSGIEAETQMRFHLVKFWSKEPRITLDNLFSETCYSENFPFQSVSLSDESSNRLSKTVSRVSVDDLAPRPAPTIEEEFMTLFEQYLFENTAKFHWKGKPVDTEKITSEAVNRACDFLMRKHGISESKIVDIVTKALHMDTVEEFTGQTVLAKNSKTDKDNNGGKAEEKQLIHKTIELLSFTMSATEPYPREQHVLNEINRINPDRVIIVGGWGKDLAEQLIKSSLSDQYEIYINESCSLSWLCQTIEKSRTGNKKAILMSNFPRETSPPTALNICPATDKSTRIAIFFWGPYTNSYCESVYFSQVKGGSIILCQLLVDPSRNNSLLSNEIRQLKAC
jgi:hypothetical protein